MQEVIAMTKPKAKTSTAAKRRYNNKVYAKVQAELPRELVEQFKLKCKETDTSQASVLRDAIADFLKED